MKPETEFTREHILDYANSAKAPRVALFCDYDETYAPIAKIARANWIEYATRHGYGVRWYREFHLDPSRPKTYGDKGRFRCYYDLCGYADIILYLDVDSLFTNMAVRVEDALGVSRESGIRFGWTYDQSGPLSGLWAAGTDSTTEKHLRYAYEYAAMTNNVRHGVIEPNGISDQDAMRALMNIPPFSQTFVNCLDAVEVGHCYPENWSEGKWLVTFPGRSVEDKLREMREWRTRVN